MSKSISCSRVGFAAVLAALLGLFGCGVPIGSAEDRSSQRSLLDAAASAPASLPSFAGGGISASSVDSLPGTAGGAALSVSSPFSGAYDGAGVVATSLPVSERLSGLPTIEFAGDDAGRTFLVLGSSVGVMAAVSGLDSVHHVDFFVRHLYYPESVYLGSAQGPVFGVSWDTSSAMEGHYEFVAKAYLADGTVLNSLPVRVDLIPAREMFSGDAVNLYSTSDGMQFLGYLDVPAGQVVEFSISSAMSLCRCDAVQYAFVRFGSTPHFGYGGADCIIATEGGVGPSSCSAYSESAGRWFVLLDRNSDASLDFSVVGSFRPGP